MNIFNKKENTEKRKDEQDFIGLKLTEETLSVENIKNDEIADGIFIEIKESDLFKESYLLVLEKKIMNVLKVGYGYTDPFDKSDCLNLEEKKSLNLNARAKYSKELINNLTEKGLQEIKKDKDFFKNIFLRNFYKISRKYELKQMRDSGIKKVIIENCNDEKDCKNIKHLQKHWDIDEVPELPLPGCTAAYCRCMYIADDTELF